MSQDLQVILQVADRAAREASAGLLRSFGSANIREKSTQNLVTEADLESERVIAAAVARDFPGHTMMQEETEFTGSILADDLWIVDPIDGTNNYAHGIPQFCISIAYARRGVVQAGVVYDPIRDEMFAATLGGGATLNGHSIRVSTPDGLQRSIIATGFYYDRGVLITQTLDTIRRLFDANVRGVRRMGAAALDLVWVACGRFQGYFEYHLSPWDYAAGALIVTEAGGCCHDRYGEAIDLHSQSMIAACASIDAEFLRIVRQSPPGP
jgi:myo-inositol-1(or 4)-monophosphatase